MGRVGIVAVLFVPVVIALLEELGTVTHKARYEQLLDWWRWT